MELLLVVIIDGSNLLLIVLNQLDYVLLAWFLLGLRGNLAVYVFTVVLRGNLKFFLVACGKLAGCKLGCLSGAT